MAFPIQATFDAGNGRLEYVAFDGKTSGPKGGMDYDPSRKVLYSKNDPATVLRRRATTVPEDVRKKLGM
jgi:hypothetical protein